MSTCHSLVGVNYLGGGGRIDSSDLLPLMSRCLM